MINKSLLLFFLIAGQIYAWSHVIHRAVAEDVQTQLSPRALSHIQSILGPLPLSYWADWADKTDKYPKNWHYVAINVVEDVCVGQPHDLHCALEYLINSEKSSKSIDEKDRLRLLLHLVVDAHQPLHVDMEHFRNPNCQVRTPNKVGLHQWMDRDALGVRADVYEVSQYVKSIRLNDTGELSLGKPSEWLRENVQYWSSIYPPYEGEVPYYCKFKAKKLPYINEKQKEEVSKIVLLRLSMASVRLAALLNDMYGK